MQTSQTSQSAFTSADQARAALLLDHAVAYLLNRQITGSPDPVQASREAISVLCHARKTFPDTDFAPSIRASRNGSLRVRDSSESGFIPILHRRH